MNNTPRKCENCAWFSPDLTIKSIVEMLHDPGGPESQRTCCLHLTNHKWQLDLDHKEYYMVQDYSIERPPEISIQEDGVPLYVNRNFMCPRWTEEGTMIGWGDIEVEWAGKVQHKPSDSSSATTCHAGVFQGWPDGPSTGITLKSKGPLSSIKDFFTNLFKSKEDRHG